MFIAKRTTSYKNHSDSQLFALFSSENWRSLSFSERLNACQELANRFTAESGVYSCKVTHAPMEGACYGWQKGNCICLNTHLLEDGQFCSHYTDSNGQLKEILTDVSAPGWNVMETVFHEGTHCVQEAEGRTPRTYISPDMDYELYRIQQIEKEAFAAGQLRTLNALSEYEIDSGKLDPDRNDYIAAVKNNSFQSALSEAAYNYNDTKIEQTLQDVIKDKDNMVTRQKPSSSYQAINNLYSSYMSQQNTYAASVRDGYDYGGNGVIDQIKVEDGSESFNKQLEETTLSNLSDGSEQTSEKTNSTDYDDGFSSEDSTDNRNSLHSSFSSSVENSAYEM